MKFVKYQAIGNDFVIIDSSAINSEQAEMICNRNFGIGADGVLIHYKSEKADAGMKIINSDGSIAVMCGNGLRCFAAYLITDCGYSKNPLIIETDRGVLTVKWEKNSHGELIVEANLGFPELVERFEEMSLFENKLETAGISMGNPHVVVLTAKKLGAGEIRKVANHLQKNNSFGSEVNVEVVTDINKKEKSVFVVVKERGAGFTLGCGTGGAAVVYALKLKGIVTDDSWTVFFPGGVAEYRIGQNGEIIMSGIPEKVFSGVLDSGLLNG